MDANRRPAAESRRGVARLRRPPGQLRGPVRPAAPADRQAQARRHRGGAVPGHRRVHRLHPGAGRRVGPRRRRASSSSSRPPCSTSRRPGCCRAARSRTRRTSRCWRPATCCSPGCCSTGRTSRSPLMRRMARRESRRLPARGRPGGAVRRVLPDVRARHSGRSEFAALAAAGADAEARAGRSGSPTSTRRGSACASRPRCSSTGCAAAARRPSAPCRRLPGHAARVARFLALLELYREGAVAFDQVQPLGELTVRWTGRRGGRGRRSTDEFDGARRPPRRRRP